MNVEVAFNGSTVIKVIDYIDFSNVEELSGAVSTAISSSESHIIVDLTDTNYIDSSGIAAIYAAYKFLYPDRKLAVITGNDKMKALFDIVHYKELEGLYIVGDLAAALRVTASGTV